MCLRLPSNLLFDCRIDCKDSQKHIHFASASSKALLIQKFRFKQAAAWFAKTATSAVELTKFDFYTPELYGPNHVPQGGEVDFILAFMHRPIHS